GANGIEAIHDRPLQVAVVAAGLEDGHARLARGREGVRVPGPRALLRQDAPDGDARRGQAQPHLGAAHQKATSADGPMERLVLAHPLTFTRSLAMLVP